MKKNNAYVIVGTILSIAAVGVLIKLGMTLYQPKASLTATAGSVPESVVTSTMETAPDEEPDVVIPDYTKINDDKTQETVDPNYYYCPIDFDTLQYYNSDIYAWIRIEGTNIDFPIVQKKNNDSFYLTHNSDGNYSSAGAIFTEQSYNSKSFNDPVTIIYGHHMRSGAMFGKLQKTFTKQDFWNSNPVIEIYTPERLLRYQVFAAVPYNGKHILHYNDFSKESKYTSFFNGVFSIREMQARFHSEYKPTYGDKVIILSTCLIRNNTRRFLVMGKLVYDSSTYTTETSGE